MSTDIGLNSITVADAGSETKVIDLNSSCDNQVTCIDYNTAYNKNTDLSSIKVDGDIKAGINSSEDVQPVRPSDDEPQPVFKVMFRDESISRLYRQQIKDFLCSLMHLEPSHKEDVNASSLILEVWDNKDNFKETELRADTIDNNKLKENENTQSNNLLFTIDKQPNAVCDFDIPTYGQKYEGMFAQSKSETSKNFTPNINCFNCNGNHNLRDCVLPRNQNNINKNRKEFVTKYNTGIRYHMSEDQRFSHMIPGQISQKLRRALGLRDNELPKHIYRMRLLGYPPGWLEEARLQHSGLSLFNSDGVAENDTNKKPGEIITDGNRDQYDMKKIYDFPGFNVLPPAGTIDDSHKYWVPQMLHKQSKEVMLMRLQGREADDGYKRKKMKTFTPVKNTVETCSDMEIEDAAEAVVENVPINGYFIPPLPKESIPIVPAPPSSELFQPTTEDSDSQLQEFASFDSADETTANSPSLSDLESTKKELLIELENTSLQSNSDSTSLKNDSNITFELNTSFSCIADISAHSSHSQSPLNANQGSIKIDSKLCADVSHKNDLNTSIISESPVSNKTILFQSNCTPTQSSTSRRSSSTNQASVKSVHLGTPVLPSTSPYNKLPPSEKFSKDICDVINFENLPDTTGKYEKMTGVLQKVRSTMAKLNEQS